MSEADQHELLDVAREAAHAAAAELTARLGTASGVRTKSTPTDLVSDADVVAEGAIRSVIARRRPRDAVTGEEGGATGSGLLRWVVDPLDGTINYLFGIPIFAVSVACQGDGETLAGVVLDPVRQECFEATCSGAPTLNGEVISGSECTNLSQAMIATGFGYDARVRRRQATVLERVLPRVRDIRRAGSAAIDLAWCSCGRYDAYYERGVNTWDFAAGALIAARAGLEVRRLEPAGLDPFGIVAAPAALVDDLVALVGADGGGEGDAI